MRKFSRFLLIFLIVNSMSCFAEIGDIAGDVYETDIKTYFFDYELNSYNIGGETVIICEDLGWYYGFYVDWISDERKLEITDTHKTSTYIKNFEEIKQRDISQNIANRPVDYFNTDIPKHIYHTDIITYLDGNEIRSYNVNGRTAIVVEDLRNYGYDVIWNEENRTLNVYEIFENKPIDTDIGKGYITGWVPEYNSLIARNTQFVYKIKAKDEEQELNCFDGEYFYDIMLPLDETFDFFNIKYSFENNILTIDTSEAKTFTEIDFQERKVKHNDLQNGSLTYLYIENVVLNKEHTNIYYYATTGHFDMMRTSKYKAEPYVCNGKVYIPYDFLCDVLNIPQ